MPRSSRHKSHKQSKHSANDTRDYCSDSEENVKMKERNSSKKEAVSARVSKDSSHSALGEKRKLSSSLQFMDGKDGKDLSGHGNGDVSEEYVSSKRRKDKSEGSDGDRWNGGGDKKCDGGAAEKDMRGESSRNDSENGLKSRESKGSGDSKSRSSKRHESSGEKEEKNVGSVVEKEESRSASGRPESTRNSEKDSGRKEGKEFKEVKEKECGSDRDNKKGHESRRESEVWSADGVAAKKYGSQSEKVWSADGVAAKKYGSQSEDVGDDRQSKRGREHAGKRTRKDIVIAEAYPESEYNPSRDILEGDSHISIQDLLDPLQGKSGFGVLRKNVHRMERNSTSLHTPLPRPQQERLERKVAYELTKKDITKWEPLVKRNREAPTIYFGGDRDVGFSTVGAIAYEFEPRTDFEKKIASLINDNDIVEAHRKDGCRLLELNEISLEDVKDQQNRLAKMRSLLFRHEVKAKRIKKIKSKTYHRLLKKDRLKATAATMEMDAEAAKELAMKQEFKRAEERLTLRHKKNSKWARRIIERGLDVQDEGTRAAIAEQLHQHSMLTRKMNSMKESSDESSSDDGSDETNSDQEGQSTLLKKAKEKTFEVLEGDEELPKSGVLSLPFMVRGLKKRNEAVEEEARLALQEYEFSLKQLEDINEEERKDNKVSSGRMVFGAPKKQAPESESRDKMKLDNYYGNSDSEEDTEGIKGQKDDELDESSFSQRNVNIDPNLFREESEIGHDDVFKSFDDIVKDPGAKTTYEVAIFASNSWEKMKNVSNGIEQRGVQNDGVSEAATTKEPALDDPDMEEENSDSDSNSGGQMVDGILSSGPKSSYELPSQEELIRRAFAGDDVEEDFEKDKEEVLNKENPEPEKPVLLPGWGQWTDIQKKQGLPSWMLEEHENAKKKREDALKKRRDAHLSHVIIIEKLDKKAEKLHTKTLPYPYTSKEVFEQSIRMPIGLEFNPATVVGALNRPEVVKKSGIIIKPIRFQDINPHEKAPLDHKNYIQKQQKS